jgi:CRP/FNR family transcriptional regulator
LKTIFDSDKDFICNITAPCFQVLSEEETKLVKASRTQVLFRKGDNLTKQGAYASYVLFITEGLALQYIEGDENKSFNLKILKPGDFVGLSAVFTKNTFDYSSIALKECRAFLIEKEAIATVFKNNGLFGFNFMKRYCDQNTDIFQKVRVILYKHMNGRLAENLLYINSIKKENPEVFQLLSRKDLADFAGISTESTVKILKSMEKDKIISLNEKDIEILNPDKLLQISKTG